MNLELLKQINERVVKACQKKSNPNMARNGDKNGRTKIREADAAVWNFLQQKYAGKIPAFFISKLLNIRYGISQRHARRIVQGARKSTLPGSGYVKQIERMLVDTLEPYGYLYGTVGVALSKTARDNNAGKWKRIKEHGLQNIFKFLKTPEEHVEVNKERSGVLGILERAKIIAQERGIVYV